MFYCLLLNFGEVVDVLKVVLDEGFGIEMGLVKDFFVYFFDLFFDFYCGEGVERIVGDDVLVVFCIFGVKVGRVVVVVEKRQFFFECVEVEYFVVFVVFVVLGYDVFQCEYWGLF